jgi:hypothetical protein
MENIQRKIAYYLQIGRLKQRFFCAIAIKSITIATTN